MFAAAYVWADLAGSPLAERLALACLYATLSLRAPSVLRGALSLRELVRAAESHGVPMPPAARGLSREPESGTCLPALPSARALLDSMARPFNRLEARAR